VGGEAATAQPQPTPSTLLPRAAGQAEDAAGSDEVLTGEVVADEPEQPVGSSTG